MDLHIPRPRSTPLLATLWLVAGCREAAPEVCTGPAAPAYADYVILGADIETMDESAPHARAVAWTDGQIVAVGSEAQVLEWVGPDTLRVAVPAGAAVLPGFIDPHSHMAAYGFFMDSEHWLDVASTNNFFKPPPGDPRCTTPDDPQRCFIPATTHEAVLARITAWAHQRGRTEPVLAFNYDPSRLGHGPTCPDLQGVGFACPNFEDGRARAQLDAISDSIPILVTSQSGHITYVNTPALKQLNICGLPGSTERCYTPTINPEVETKLAALGQLDEDLSLYAIGQFQGQLLKANPGLGERQLQRGAEVYAAHGYTVAQEGAASLGLVALYVEALVKHSERFPVAAEMVIYDSGTTDFRDIVRQGELARAAIGEHPLLHVAALKSFADGSPQGYTANLSRPYLELYPPFTDPWIFPQQPYTGLPDVTGRELAARLELAHSRGFPMIIHQNGDASIAESVAAIVGASLPPAGLRDVVLHAPMITPALLDLLATRKDSAVVSYLMENTYFFGLPECQQVLGRDVINMYPARASLDRGLRVTLHSDSPVGPPDPLFQIWVAATRRAQQPAWYPNTSGCPIVMVDARRAPGDQRISIREGVRAFTVDAAWQYGMESVRGTITPGKYADFVLLSDDPLTLETADHLRTVRVLGTVRRGALFENPNGALRPIWPG